ncbi:MAG TPA: hypothetical protein PK867_22860, partial [Pirellulales bacterium]|nr:hypothetical protein [Pirellulales bacterium]
MILNSRDRQSDDGRLAWTFWPSLPLAVADACWAKVNELAYGLACQSSNSNPGTRENSAIIRCLSNVP